MKLIPISAAIFFLILSLILLVTLFPSYGVIGFAVITSTCLVLFQAFIILKDQPER